MRHFYTNDPVCCEAIRVKDEFLNEYKGYSSFLAGCSVFRRSHFKNILIIEKLQATKEQLASLPRIIGLVYIVTDPEGNNECVDLLTSSRPKSELETDKRLLNAILRVEKSSAEGFSDIQKLIEQLSINDYQNELLKLVDRLDVVHKQIEIFQEGVRERIANIDSNFEKINESIYRQNEKAKEINSAYASIAKDLQNTRSASESANTTALETLSGIRIARKEFSISLLSVTRQLDELTNSVKQIRTPTSNSLGIQEMREKLDQALKHQATLSQQMAELTTAILKLQNRQPTPSYQLPKQQKKSSANLIWFVTGAIITFFFVTVTGL